MVSDPCEGFSLQRRVFPSLAHPLHLSRLILILKRVAALVDRKIFQHQRGSSVIIREEEFQTEVASCHDRRSELTVVSYSPRRNFQKGSRRREKPKSRSGREYGALLINDERQTQQAQRPERWIGQR